MRDRAMSALWQQGPSFRAMRFGECLFMGLGCVKTQKLNLRIENSSRLRQFKKQQHWRPLSGVDNREDNSASSSRAHVFTQPGSFTTPGGLQRLRWASLVLHRAPQVGCGRFARKPFKVVAVARAECDRLTQSAVVSGKNTDSSRPTLQRRGGQTAGPRDSFPRGSRSPGPLFHGGPGAVLRPVWA